MTFVTFVTFVTLVSLVVSFFTTKAQSTQRNKLKIEFLGNEMLINLGSKLKATNVDSHHDHRIAMCLAIAASRLEGETTISGAEAVSKSYPKFWEDLNKMKI